MQRMARTGNVPQVRTVVQPERILSARLVLNELYMDDRVAQYIVDLVLATRQPADYNLSALAPLIDFGASPRASINLNLAARAHAFLSRRAYVTPEDVRSVALDVLRHRVTITYEAEAEEMEADTIVQRILESIEVP